MIVLAILKATHHIINTIAIKIKLPDNYTITESIFWFGTDRFGRDLLSRLIYGIRISLSVGFISVIISLIIGILLRLLAGNRGIIDSTIMWLVNVVWQYQHF